jgi:hypothetical protein
MSTDEDLFKVENETQERLRNKYRAFKTDIIESRFDSCRIQIQLRIAEEYLKISDEELKEQFIELCRILLDTCDKYQIPREPTDLLILTDEEIDRGLQIKLKDEKDGSLWDMIFIPSLDLNAPDAFWNYTFLHELGHCWISIAFKDLEIDEIFTDLVAVTALKKIVPLQESLYKETVILRSYIGGGQGRGYFGKEVQEKVLKDPEPYLRKMIGLVMERGNNVDPSEFTRSK